MDFMRQLESGYLQVNDLNRIVRECRTMANKLGLTIRWRVKERTTTAFLKFNQTHILWKANYTNEMPHMMMCLMYIGLHKELVRRTKENQEAALRMKLLEEEKARERKIMNMPTWQERNNNKASRN